MIEDWNDSEYCLMSVREHPLNLEFVINQTHEMCLQAVKEDGYNLEYVKEQTSEICLEAVKRNGFALQYVKEQTPLIIHYLKKYHISLYETFKKKNRIAISENEMKKFYNENPHLLLTLYL